MTPVELAWACIWLAAAGLILAWLGRGGLLSGRAFDRSPPRRGTLGVPDLFVGAFLFIAMQWLLLEFLPRSWLPSASDGSSTGEMLRGMLLSHIITLPVAFYLLWRAPLAVEGGLRGLGLDPAAVGPSFNWAVRALAASLPLILGVSAVMTLILMALDHRPPTIAHGALDVLVRQPGGVQWWGLVASAVVIAPILEELIFRGLVQTSLGQSGLMPGRWSAIAWTSLLFAWIHTSIASPHALPVLYVLSVAMGWAYERWGSLWTPIFMHMMFNALQITIAMNIPLNEG